MPGYFVCLCSTCVQRTQRAEEGISFLETGVKNVVVHHVGAEKVNPGPLEEQPALLTSQPSLQSCLFSEIWSHYIALAALAHTEIHLLLPLEH